MVDPKDNLLIPDKNYFFIREVAEIVGVKAHTLRYWEDQFKQLRPARRESNQRKYTKKDIYLINEIKDMLHNQGFTTEGVRIALAKKHRETRQGQLPLQTNTPAMELLQETRKVLEEILDALK
ncbi:MAG: MerR family transcriptional regulator [Elusimicrobiota bacterium]